MQFYSWFRRDCTWCLFGHGILVRRSNRISLRIESLLRRVSMRASCSHCLRFLLNLSYRSCARNRSSKRRDSRRSRWASLLIRCTEMQRHFHSSHSMRSDASPLLSSSSLFELAMEVGLSQCESIAAAAVKRIGEKSLWSNSSRGT